MKGKVIQRIIEFVFMSSYFMFQTSVEEPVAKQRKEEKPRKEEAQVVKTKAVHDKRESKKMMTKQPEVKPAKQAETLQVSSFAASASFQENNSAMTAQMSVGSALMQNQVMGIDPVMQNQMPAMGLNQMQMMNPMMQNPMATSMPLMQGQVPGMSLIEQQQMLSHQVMPNPGMAGMMGAGVAVHNPMMQPMLPSSVASSSVPQDMSAVPPPPSLTSTSKYHQSFS